MPIKSRYYSIVSFFILNMIYTYNYNSFLSDSLELSAQEIIKNLKESNEFKERKDLLINVAEEFLNLKYEVSFVSGILGNIVHEGSYGLFEDSTYTENNLKNKPNYLKIMDEKYDYNKKYSAKNIINVNLKEINNLLEKLKEKKWTEGKFGLGCVQWTGERTYNLVKLYLKQNGGKEKIDMNQVILAENKMILNELQGEFKYIYNNWKKKNINNINSDIASYNAASDICLYYESPRNKETKAKQRANTAKKIYNILVPKKPLIFTYSVRTEDGTKVKKLQMIKDLQA